MTKRKNPGQPSLHPGRDARMNQLAEWMSEHGDDSRAFLRRAANALGWSYDSTKKVWYRICARMGAQAV